MIRNIVFDMGGVLATWNPQYIVSKLPVKDENRQLLLKEIFTSPDWARLDEGTIEEDDFLALVQSRLPEEAREDARIAMEQWDNYMEPIDGTCHLVKELKAKGYKLYLLSNAGVRYHKRLEQRAVMRLLDGRFVSADFKLIKPNPAIFETFCSHFGLRPEECVFIDDTAKNIEGSKAAKMDGIVFDGDVNRLRSELTQRGVDVETTFQMVPVQSDADVRLLSRISNEVWHQHFASILSPEQIDYMVDKFQSYPAMTRQLAEEGYQYYFIHEEGGAAVLPEHEDYAGHRGYVGFRVEEDAIFLSKLYLLQPYRGRALSSRALAFLISVAQSQGCHKIWLTVNRYNDHTIDVYKHWGFTVVREQCADIGNGFVMDDYVMQLEVPNE